MMRRRITTADAALVRILGGTPARDCETPTLDFKEDRASTNDTERLIAEAAICFANAAGGTIVLGVSDKQKGPAAFTGTALEPARIKQRVYELSRPHLNVEAERHPTHSNLVVITVPQSSEIHADTQGRAYQRINLDCLPMSPEQQTRLREERRGIDWSAEASGKPLAAVSPQALAAARAILNNFSDERRRLALLGEADLLSALGVLVDRDHLSRAGALLFCAADPEYPSEIVYQYRSTPGGEPKGVHRLGAPLVLAFARSMELVAARQALTPVTLPNGQQIAIEDFPSLAVREALSNAICHRDYHFGAPIVVEHSPAVFAVTSPGPLVSGVTPANIITTTSRPRNPSLAKAARVLGLAEELGRGVDRMYREMIRSGRPLPKIEASFDHVRVVLVGGAPDTNIARFVVTLPDDEQNDTDTMLVLFRLCAVRTITASAAAPILQKTVEEAETVLRRLSDETVGLLERTRATVRRSAAVYRLRGGALKGLGSAVTYQRRTTDEVDRKVIAHVEEYGKITNRTLQNVFDVHVFKARDIIADLVSRKILTRVSEQQRGPKVEWGPGASFPRSKRRRARKEGDETELSLFSRPAETEGVEDK
jgi:ATP-dependent DNA helicase RecG